LRPVSNSFNRRGAAFVELLVVLGIIALLVAILVPMFLHARQRANSHQCTDNLRQLGQAMFAYASSHRGQFPSTSPPSTAEQAANHVSASMFLLLKQQNLPASLFICPATNGIPDDFGGGLVSSHSNFTDISLNLRYSMQNPYASKTALDLGFTWTTSLPSDFIIMADLNPAEPSLYERIPGMKEVLPYNVYDVCNSANHDRVGQNVLYADGRIEFQTTPNCGIGGDHIYLSKSNRLMEGPQDGADSILLPTMD
jgi:type II secretory pathway pseudopilin PulG